MTPYAIVDLSTIHEFVQSWWTLEFFYDPPADSTHVPVIDDQHPQYAAVCALVATWDAEEVGKASYTVYRRPGCGDPWPMV